MDSVPDATQPDHAQVQDHLSARYRPGHPRALEPLGAHSFTGGLCDARAHRKALAALVPLAHPMRALFQGGVGLIIVLGLAPQPVLPPKGRCRLSHPRDPIASGLHGLAPLFRPCPALGRRAKQGVGSLLDGKARVGVGDHPSPLESAPGALGIGHPWQHPVVIITGMVPIITDLDQAETLAIHVAQDGVEQGSQWRREGRLTRLWHRPSIHRSPPLATAV
jgi:hypothetical protein